METVRLFWDVADKTRFGLQINPHEPPKRDPEENAYLAAMERLLILRDQIKIHTFDTSNPAHVKIIEGIKDMSNRLGKVVTDKNGDYKGFIRSDEKPNESATLNWDTLKWEAPEEAVREAELQKICDELRMLDLQAIRPLRAICAGTAIEKDREVLAVIETRADELREQRDTLEGYKKK